MLDRINSFLISVLLVACMEKPPSTPNLSGVLIDNEEQKVYAAALRTLYSARGYVIMADSATDLTGVENTATTS